MFLKGIFTTIFIIFIIIIFYTKAECKRVWILHVKNVSPKLQNEHIQTLSSMSMS